tara:strand:- start:86 stop:388 length:303 start_codon:yes stop_codon:yes gene_type:complete
MIYNNPSSERFFSKSHKTLTWGTFIFGGALFLLAVIIFAYPVLITYFFAGLILLTGVSMLTASWKLWQSSKNISHIDQWGKPVDNNCGYRTHTIYFRWHE